MVIFLEFIVWASFLSMANTLLPSSSLPKWDLSRFQGKKMKKPAQLYTPSSRKYEGLPDVSYPFHDKTVTVTK